MMGDFPPCPKCNDSDRNHPNGFLIHRKKDDGFGYFVCRGCGFELLDPKSVAKSRRIKGLFDGGWFIIGEGLDYENIEPSDLELTMNLNPVCVNLERDMVMKGLSVDQAEQLIIGLEIAVRFLTEGK